MPVPIPDGPGGVVTSTIEVSGADPYLADVDVVTDITHTFASDLEMTVTSPEGTVVTLTTDNGAGNDNVFAGTLWDDDANPGGLVPYSTTDGLATDHAYANLTLASPLAPEEGLGAFIGENPNGTWTLTVSDDAAQDTGTINSWGLGLATLAEGPQTTTTSHESLEVPVPIPDGPAVVASTLDVSGASLYLANLDVVTDITHSFAGDLEITATSPEGTHVTLTTDNGAGNDNVFAGTLWDDDANPGGLVPYSTNDGLATDHAYANLTLASPLAPEEGLGAFIGEDPNGTWTLTVSDDAAGDGGTINSWGLGLKTGACSEPAAAVFTLGKVKRNKRRGTATLEAIVPGPGELKLAGKGIKRKTKAATEAATVKLKVKAKGKKRRTLAETGKVKVRAKVTYTPTGGEPQKDSKRVKLVKRR